MPLKCKYNAVYNSNQNPVRPEKFLTFQTNTGAADNMKWL